MDITGREPHLAQPETQQAVSCDTPNREAAQKELSAPGTPDQQCRHKGKERSLLTPLGEFWRVPEVVSSEQAAGTLCLG